MSKLSNVGRVLLPDEERTGDACLGCVGTPTNHRFYCWEVLSRTSSKGELYTQDTGVPLSICGGINTRVQGKQAAHSGHMPNFCKSSNHLLPKGAAQPLLTSWLWACTRPTWAQWLWYLYMHLSPFRIKGGEEGT